MNKVWRRLSLISILAGLICLLPISLKDWRSGLTTDAAFDAIEPILRIPLHDLQANGSAAIIFDVPSDRASEAWGNPFYMVFLRSQSTNKSWWIHDFAILPLQVGVTLNGSPITLDTAGLPYAYSSDTTNIGMQFLAKPGDVVHIKFHLNSPSALPAGELVVAPNWKGANKDAFVGLILDDDFYRIARTIGWIGLVLVAFGCGVFLFRF